MAGANKVDSQWHERQVLLYAGESDGKPSEKCRYKLYADTLAAILTAACELHAPDGIVSAREKSVASFAEKAARKAHKYDDPVHQMTDLCGARVIVNTLDQMNLVCDFIRRHFKIDEANSHDASSRLNEDQFGYGSYHFVVQIERPEILGVPTPKEIREREFKAEIQVRTVLQHAWAAITHDRLYKSEFVPPARLRRLAHRQAALIESADVALNDFENDMQAYLGGYAAYLKPDALEKEVDIVQLVLAVEPDPRNKPALALRLARLFRAQHKLDDAIRTLRGHVSVDGPTRLPIRVELGTAILKRFGDSPEGEEGVGQLRSAVDGVRPAEERNRPIVERKLLAVAFAALADHARVVDRHELYTAALQLDPDDPYILCTQLAYNLNHTSQSAMLDSARPAILRAITVCQAHAAAGLQKPQAWFTAARLHLLLVEIAAAMDHYAKAIRFYLEKNCSDWPQRDFESELTFLEHIQGGGYQPLPALAWTEQFLKMGYYLSGDRKENIASATGQSISCTRFNSDRRVLIIAGGTSPTVDAEMSRYHALVKAALEDFEGVVVSGGTTAGIPGVVGNAAAELKAAGNKKFELIGYQPEFVHADCVRSPHYDLHVPSGEQETLGLGEPLRTWLDILAAGVRPENVRLLGINGGDVSRFEYALALALGATVGLVESSGRSADVVLHDPDWRKLSTLLPLPNDPLTAQAFVMAGVSDMGFNELDRMGRVVHESYLKINHTRPNHKKPNTLPWDALPEAYQQSSRDQAAYAFFTLRKLGFQIDAVAAPIGDIPEHLVERLASIEHGRWNYERICSGWRYASQKDDDKHLSPYLVAWDALPDEIKEYDRLAVRAYPRVLAAGGYRLQPPK